MYKPAVAHLIRSVRAAGKSVNVHRLKKTYREISMRTFIHTQENAHTCDFPEEKPGRLPEISESYMTEI